MRDPRRDMTPINDRIRFPQIRVIDEMNTQLGVMQTRDALDLARDRGFDLILVAPQAQPPVCRIMDYGKFKYEKSKREKVAHKKGAASEMKMVRLHPPTGEHDRQILVRHAERFLREGHKVRVVCQFRRRENAYPELGRAQLDAVADALKEFSIVEGTIIKQGRDMTMNLAPKPGVKPLPKTPKDGSKDDKVVAVDGEHDDADAEFERQQQRILESSGPQDEDGEEDHSHDAEGGIEAVDVAETVEGDTEASAVSAASAETGTAAAVAEPVADESDEDSTSQDSP